MAKGPLRIALEDLVTTGPWADPWRDFWKEQLRRINDVQLVVSNISKAGDNRIVAYFPGIVAFGLLYQLTGSRQGLDNYLGDMGHVGANSVSAQIGKVLEDTIGTPLVKEVAEVLGALVYDPIVGLLEENAVAGDIDPKEFSRRFTGAILGLQATGGILDVTLETLSAGQIDGAGRLMESAYWSLGLGFLGWQTLAPLLESGLKPGLERYYLKKSRPRRFGATDLRDLYAAGKITRDDLKLEAQFLGWRDQDIDQWINLAFRRIGEGDVWALYNRGKLSADNVTARLSQLGYAAQEIPLLFQVNGKPDINDDEVASVALLRKAYRVGIITAGELVSNLRRMHYTDRECALIIAVEDAANHQDNVTLSVSQVKSAWASNVLNDAEALHWLDDLDIPAENAKILLATWKAEAAPKFSKLNRGTITAAYVYAVINRGQAAAKLRSVGLTDEDANLELNLAEARNPDAFGNGKPKPPKELTPAIILALVKSGAYTVPQAIAKLIANRYTPEDAAAIGQLAASQLVATKKELGKGDVLAAYTAQVIGRGTAEKRLLAMGFADVDNQLLLNTEERQHPEVFGPTPDPEPKHVTLGQLTQLLAANLIGPDEVNDRLRKEGYTPADAELFTQLAVNVTTPALKGVTQSLVGRAFVASVIDRTEASNLLSGLDYTQDFITTYLDTLEAENPAVFNPDSVISLRQPTVGALVDAVRSGIITSLEFYARMAEIGYDQNGADIYLAVASSRDGKASRTLTVSDVQNAYRQNFFSHGLAIDRLTQLGYSDSDATLLLRFVRSGIEDTETWRNMLAGLLSGEIAYQQLVAAGFTQAEIDKALETLTKGPADAQS